MRIFQNFNKPILIARLKLANEIAPKVPLRVRRRIKNALKKHKSTTKVITFSKKSKESPEGTEAIAIIYAIESEKHPFHHLDGNYASFEMAHVQKYIDLDKYDVKFTNLHVSN